MKFTGLNAHRKKDIPGLEENACNQDFLRTHFLSERLLPLAFTDGTVQYMVNPLPNNKILNVTKLKAFADDKSNVTKMMISLYDREENTMGKEENAGYHHFLLFPVFFKTLFFKVIKSLDCVVKS